MTKRTPSQCGRWSRGSGQRYERKIANLLKPLFPDAKRGLQSRNGTAEAPDVMNTPFYLELKHQASPNILAALNQADLARYKVTEEGTKQVDFRPPVAITNRKNCKYNHGDVVTMRFVDWLELVKTAQHNSKDVSK